MPKDSFNNLVTFITFETTTANYFRLNDMLRNNKESLHIIWWSSVDFYNLAANINSYSVGEVGEVGALSVIMKNDCETDWSSAALVPSVSIWCQRGESSAASLWPDDISTLSPVSHTIRSSPTAIVSWEFGKFVHLHHLHFSCVGIVSHLVSSHQVTCVAFTLAPGTDPLSYHCPSWMKLIKILMLLIRNILN